MKIFISWHGEVSHQVALELRTWLKSVINALNPFVASEDIDKGARWMVEISKELEESSFGILCVTRSNDSAPWLNFEAGALSKTVDEGKVSPFLFGVKRSEIDGPILLFQSTVYDKNDVRKLIHSLYESCKPPDVTIAEVDSHFNSLWPKFKNKLDKIHDEFEEKVIQKHQLNLRETLERTASVLRSKEVHAKEIQNIVKSIVKVWSQAVYRGEERPPAPSDVAPPAQGKKIFCKLCCTGHIPTEQYCCKNCGLFCTEWLRDDLG